MRFASGRVLLLCCILLAPCGVQAGTSVPLDPQAATGLLQPPADGEHPISIRVGIYILNLVALNEVRQSFTCTGYLTETWSDPRLAFNPRRNEGSRRYYRKDAVWFPLLQFDNSASPRVVSGYLLSGDPAGVITYVEKFSVRLSSNMPLRAFPFDSQNLEVVVHPFTGQANQIVMSVDPASTGISRESYTPLPLWKTGRVSYGTMRETMEGGDPTPSHLIFQIRVVRNSEYYIFRIFLPLFLMVAVSWGVLWIPPHDLNSQLLISVTTILTLVAFSVALSNTLPPVPYLTFYDGFFLISFLFILISIGESLMVHAIYNSHGDGTALKARRVTRILVPVLFVLVVPVLALSFFR